MWAQLSVSMYVSTYSLKRMTQGSCHFCSLFSNNLCFCLFLLVVILLFFVLMHPFVNFLLYIIIPTYTHLMCLLSWEFVLRKFSFLCPPLTRFCVYVYKKKEANCNFLLLSSLPRFVYLDTALILFFCQ